MKRKVFFLCCLLTILLLSSCSVELVNPDSLIAAPKSNQEKLQKKNIDIVVNESEVPANIMADGRHLWRVFDNIMTNICKYTQEHTRVYVDVTDAGDEVNMTFKNISKYPLNITSDELMERFVRGDASRNTEGHGLGLSIAQSLTELMGGQLSIAIDGDLFKITVAMKKQA